MSATNRAVVLFSGGMDSTIALFWALARYEVPVAVAVDYGQHQGELHAAARIASIAEVRLEVLDLRTIRQLGDSSLFDDAPPAPGAVRVGVRRVASRLAQHAPLQRVAAAAMAPVLGSAAIALPRSYVPGRNVIMLAAAGAMAAREDAKVIVTGLCSTDGTGYPDCRREFVDAFQRVLDLGLPRSTGPMSIETPLMYHTKADAVGLAQRLGAKCWQALGQSVTCADGTRAGCGTCQSCLLREAGFVAAKTTDPAKL